MESRKSSFNLGSHASHVLLLSTSTYLSFYAHGNSISLQLFENLLRPLRFRDPYRSSICLKHMVRRRQANLLPFQRPLDHPTSRHLKLSRVGSLYTSKKRIAQSTNCQESSLHPPGLTPSSSRSATAADSPPQSSPRFPSTGCAKPRWNSSRRPSHSRPIPP